MKEIIDFLARLEKNNNREWFQAHKSEYLSVQEEFNIFTEKLIAGIAEFDNTINGLTAKDCTYRIYRDTRFSPDKRPYKCHLGAFVCPQGKKSGFSGYYNEWWHYTDGEDYPVCEALGEPEYISCAAQTELLAAPQAGAEALAAAPAGSRLRLLDSVGDYLLVNFEGQYGYVLKA